MGRKTNVAAWVVASLLAAQFLLAGWMKLSGAPEMVHNFAVFGYPQWFRQFIGAAEVAGALGLLVPGLRFWAAAGLTVIMGGAIDTHVTIGDSFAHTLPAVLSFVLLVTLAWVRRPQLLRRARAVPIES